MSGSGITIGIVGGAGKLGSGLALHWASRGLKVVVGSRDPARSAAAVDRVRARVGRSVEITCDDYEGTAGRADVVVLCVPFTAQVVTLKKIRDHLRSAPLLLDVTVPLAATLGGAPTHTITPWEGSAAQQAAALVPDGVRVVSALHSVSAELLDRWPEAVEGDVLMAGDDARAKEQAAVLIEAIPDLRPVDAGPLEMARHIEPMTAVLIGINRRYRAHGVGMHITGLPRAGEPSTGSEP